MKPQRQPPVIGLMSVGSGDRLKSESVLVEESLSFSRGHFIDEVTDRVTAHELLAILIFPVANLGKLKTHRFTESNCFRILRLIRHTAFDGLALEFLDFEPDVL